MTAAPDSTEILAGREKTAKLGERFSHWRGRDPEHPEAVVRVGRDRFNAVVLGSPDNTQTAPPSLAVSCPSGLQQFAEVARMDAVPAALVGQEALPERARPR